jgi:hypothetical protein
MTRDADRREKAGDGDDDDRVRGAHELRSHSKEPARASATARRPISCPASTSNR